MTKINVSSNYKIIFCFFYLKELRLNTLTEENAALRKALSEREDAVSKMRIELHQTSTRVIDYKVEIIK